MFLCNKLTFSHLLENWYWIQLGDYFGMHLSLELLIIEMNPTYDLVFLSLKFIIILFTHLHLALQRGLLPTGVLPEKYLPQLPTFRSSRSPQFDGLGDVWWWGRNHLYAIFSILYFLLYLVLGHGEKRNVKIYTNLLYQLSSFHCL